MRYSITSSDHIPIIFKVSTRPFYVKQKKTYKLSRGNWKEFKNNLDQEFTVKKSK